MVLRQAERCNAFHAIHAQMAKPDDWKEKLL